MEAPPWRTPHSVNTAESEERAIEAGFVAHEAWAFEAAYASFKRLLYGAAFDVLQDRSAAEDCVHDVLLRLWQRSDAYSSNRGRLRVFLAICVRNEALSRKRRDTNRIRIEKMHLPMPEPQSSPEHLVADRLEAARALHMLNTAQLQAVQLAYNDGLTYVEIAQRLNEPVGTIKSRISNAIRLLRQNMTSES